MFWSATRSAATESSKALSDASGTSIAFCARTSFSVWSRAATLPPRPSKMQVIAADQKRPSSWTSVGVPGYAPMSVPSNSFVPSIQRRQPLPLFAPVKSL